MVVRSVIDLYSGKWAWTPPGKALVLAKVVVPVGACVL